MWRVEADLAGVVRTSRTERPEEERSPEATEQHLHALADRRETAAD